MKKLLISAVMLLIGGITAFAQESEFEWNDITTLHLAASGSKDYNHCLRQFLLFDEAAVDSHPEIFDRYHTFAEEYGQILLDTAVPEGLQAYDEGIAQMEKMIKDHPEMADMLKAQIAELKAARMEFEGMASQERKELSVDPVALLKDLTAIAVGKKAFTGWQDMGDGLYAVTDAPRYGTTGETTDMPESSRYTWGLIDSKGRVVVPMKYNKFRDYHKDYDIIFPETIDKNGKVRAGALDYDGRIRIPFEYDSLGYALYEYGCVSFWKDDKMGLLTLDGKLIHPFEFSNAECIGTGWVVSKTGSDWGVMDTKGNIVIPMKYKDYWGLENDEVQLERHDGRLDAYRNGGNFEFLRTFDKPEGY